MLFQCTVSRPWRPGVRESSFCATAAGQLNSCYKSFLEKNLRHLIMFWKTHKLSSAFCTATQKTCLQPMMKLRPFWKTRLRMQKNTNTLNRRKMGVGRSGAPTYSCHPYPTEGNVSGSNRFGDRDRQAREQVTPSGDKRLHIPCRKVQRGGIFVSCLVSMGAGKIARPIRSGTRN